MIEVEVHGTQWVLHPDRAVFWPSQEMLIVTDLHLGKIQHFRNAGIYLPPYAAYDNYERLSGLLLEFSPKTLLILGDLFHSNLNQDWKNFCELRDSFSHIHFELVPGNHDILDDNLFLKNNILLHQERAIFETLSFSHYPEKNSNAHYYNVAGHLHPGIRLVGDGLQSLRLPIFYLGANHALLPSFGTFTGTSLIEVQPGDQVIAITKDTLVPIEN
ncbi:MAG: ligase-associated DNA damage response endonuclease PdeM [Saprospiraceae bacterium]|nr:ligase-associated DNA damage response endonuclease PdeM [Saprospiraceae bacterium]